jgi:hypothetical protein
MRYLLTLSLLLASARPLLANVGVVEKVAAHNTANATSYDTSDGTNTTVDAGTGTISIASNALALCFVVATASSNANLGTLSISGGSVSSWTSIANVDFDTIAIATKRLQAWRGLGTGATAAGVVVTTTGSLTSVDFDCWELTSVNTTTPVAQSKTNSSDSATSLAIGTFGSALGAAQAVLMAGVSNGNFTWTPDTSFTTGTEITNATPTSELKVQYLVNGTNANPQWAWSGASGAKGVLAVEVTDSGSGGTLRPCRGLGPLLGIGCVAN